MTSVANACATLFFTVFQGTWIFELLVFESSLRITDDSCSFILAFIKNPNGVQVAGFLRDIAFCGMTGMKASVGGVSNHQTLSGFCLDARLLKDFSIVDGVGAHQYLQLVRQLTNRGQICCGRLFTKVKHHKVSLFVTVELSKVREDVCISLNVAEPASQKGKLCLPQAVQKVILKHCGSFTVLLDLDGKDWKADVINRRQI